MSTPNKYGPRVGSRARWLRRYETTPSTAGRRVRRAMGVILRLPQGDAVKAVRRLLGVDPVAAAAFLQAWQGEPSPVRKAPLFPRAFNAPALDMPEHLGVTSAERAANALAVRQANRQARNAAKAERRKAKPKGPAEQPRTPRRSRAIGRAAMREAGVLR